MTLRLKILFSKIQTERSTQNSDHWRNINSRREFGKVLVGSKRQKITVLPYIQKFSKGLLPYDYHIK